MGNLFLVEATVELIKNTLQVGHEIKARVVRGIPGDSKFVCVLCTPDAIQLVFETDQEVPEAAEGDIPRIRPTFEQFAD